MKFIDKLIIACIRRGIKTSSQLDDFLGVDNRSLISRRLYSLINKGYIERETGQLGTTRLLPRGQESPYYGFFHKVEGRNRFALLSKFYLYQQRVITTLADIDGPGVYVPLSAENWGIQATVWIESPKGSPAFQIASNTGVLSYMGVPRTFSGAGEVRDYIEAQASLRRNGFGEPWAELKGKE